MKTSISVLCFLAIILCITDTASAECNLCDLKGAINKPYKCDGLKKRDACENEGCYFCPKKNPTKGLCYRGFACRRDSYTITDIDACRDNDTHVPEPKECLERPGCSYCINGTAGLCISDTEMPPSSCVYGHDQMCYPFPDADITESQCTASEGCKYCGSEETDPNKKCVRDGCPSGAQLRYHGGSCCNITGTTTSLPRIAGGEPAEQDQWPWLVSVVTQSGSLCGGVLLSSEYVVSAAHCYDGSGITIGLGSVDRFIPAVTRNVIEVNVHPEYVFPFNDIMLLKIPPVTFTSGIRPIDLPMGEVPPDGMTCHVAGWGTMVYQGSAERYQREVAVRIVPFDDCDAIFVSDLNETIHMCATGDLGQGGQDPCPGDSGGPLMCQRCSSCDWYLSGIVIFGYQCAVPGVPSGYSRIIGFSSWISGITGIAIDDTLYNCDMY